MTSDPSLPSAAREPFRNDPVPAGALEELPDYTGVDLRPVAAAFVRYRTLRTAAITLAVLALAVVGDRILRITPTGFSPVWLPAAVAVLGAVVTVWVRTEAGRRAWALRRHDLIYRQGLLFHSTVVLPFARIQHVETASGPLERAFGLRRLRCFTAGGWGANLDVLGLELVQARRIRRYLLEQIGRDEDESGEEEGAAREETGERGLHRPPEPPAR